MTTKASELIQVDPWDYFLDEDSPAQEHVEMFREVYWPYIRREMRNELGYELGEGQEPHWVEAGRAVLYHQTTVSDYGRVKDYGFGPTNPLPVGNAVQLHNYLKKGFRLRSNVEPLADVESSETADSAEGDAWAWANAPYVVSTARNDRKFISWDAYRMYCQNRGVPLSYEPPQEVLDRMKDWIYFCLVHDHGFKAKRDAQQHRAYYIADPPRGRGQRHATLDEMEVKTPEQTTNKTTNKTTKKTKVT